MLEKLSKFCHPLVPWAPNEMRSEASEKLQYVLVAQMVVRLTKVSAHLFDKIDGYTQTLTVRPGFCSPLMYRKVLHLFGSVQSLWKEFFGINPISKNIEKTNTFLLQYENFFLTQ